MDIVTYLREKTKKAHEKAQAEEEEAARQKAEREKGLQDLKDIFEQNGPGDTPSYQRFDYDSPSDEEIRKSAEEELKGYENSGENAIRNEYAQREKELSRDKESSKALYDESSKELLEAYEKSAEALSNDALKRGLARSSIALNGQIEAGKEYNENAAALLGEYDRKISEIDDELNGLGTQLQSALDSFRIDHAAKLAERINELKAQREKSEREAIEYNNSLEKREYDERKAAQKTAGNNRNDKKSYQRQLYDRVSAVLDSLPKEVARELFNSQRLLFRDKLDDVYYNALHTRFA